MTLRILGSRLWTFAVAIMSSLVATGSAAEIDFNREIRPILSNNCWFCHGPDEKERKGGSDGLRLDQFDAATADLGGHAAIVPGKPEASELVARILSTDPDLRMPPAGKGKQLTEREIELLKRWIAEGAKFATHWSYVAPVRPTIPETARKDWARGDIDRLLLSRLEREGLSPSAEADRPTLIRRVALDLTGLPPTIEEVQRFVADQDPQAFEKMVDRFLEKPSFGEHWARMWLDLARYADSAGYADDPPRTIWGFRDYVIRAFNANKPFNEFTIEQFAGDLLPNATHDQLTATAFHRNTLTNSEGGTNDEEFRNVAIVDRVNTTAAVWLGTSMACAQCHTHKYDPISQTEYFRFFAILNNTQDEDRRDEAPLLEFFTDEQQRRRNELTTEIASIEQKLRILTPAMEPAYHAWRERLATPIAWNATAPVSMKSESGATLTAQGDASVLVANGAKVDVYEVELPLTEGAFAGLRLEAIPDDSLPARGPGFAGNFVITALGATILPRDSESLAARYVRIENPESKILSLAEVQVFGAGANLALAGEASQSSTGYGGEAKRAIDGETNGNYYEKNSVTHNEDGDSAPWWEVDLKEVKSIDRIVVWNRTDGGAGVRLKNAKLVVLDGERKPLFERVLAEAPETSAEIPLSAAKDVTFAFATADYSQRELPAENLLKPEKPATPGGLVAKGWAIGGGTDTTRSLFLSPAAPIAVAEGARLRVRIEQRSVYENHTLGRFRLSTTADDRIATLAATPTEIIALAKKPDAERSSDESKRLAEHYTTSVAPEWNDLRTRRGQAQKDYAAIMPSTTPIFRELAADKRRKTRLQHRGNFEDLGDEVTEGVPSILPSVKLADGERLDRLTLAKWLVARENPLTARVVANRFWEQIFGVGIVRTSEEFGSQGELPSHPELLDYLAVEFMDSGWNIKSFLRALVTSAAYRQTSKAPQELLDRDPENRLLARGPRTRLAAEMVRDQALAASGLLSDKMYGPSVRPPRPSMGLSAAFGGGLDWQTSSGEDRWRRGLYTEWRRSSPYPSMSVFDAPNREVCTLRRPRTNTPLQALVTLNDPVYYEAAQALGRKMIAAGPTIEERVTHGFLRTLSRAPTSKEVERIAALVADATKDFATNRDAATTAATEPLGPLPEGADPVEYAVWSVIGNALLNLDETTMKR